MTPTPSRTTPATTCLASRGHGHAVEQGSTCRFRPCRRPARRCGGDGSILAVLTAALALHGNCLDHISGERSRVEQDGHRHGRLRDEIYVTLAGADGASATALQPPPHLLTTLPAPAGGGRCGSHGPAGHGRRRAATRNRNRRAATARSGADSRAAPAGATSSVHFLDEPGSRRHTIVGRINRGSVNLDSRGPTGPKP